jgi:hypothetical protein
MKKPQTRQRPRPINYYITAASKKFFDVLNLALNYDLRLFVILDSILHFAKARSK